MYAVLKTGGRQFKVAEGDTIEVNRLKTGEGESHTFDQVLLVNQDGSVKVGAPIIEGATVDVEVVNHLRGPKLVIFKMKRRKGYRKKQGHRQELSRVKINKIHV